MKLGEGIPFGHLQLLALVLGRKYDLLPQQLHEQLRANSSSVAHLQFSNKSLSPICLTLLRLKLYPSKLLCHLLTPKISKQEKVFAAFILRHFKMMQEYHRPLLRIHSTAEAVYLLHKHQQQPSGIPVTGRSSSQGLGLIEWTVNAPFHGMVWRSQVYLKVLVELISYYSFFLGQLNLVSLRGINYKSLLMIEAITALCPHLKEVYFAHYFATTDEHLLPITQLRSALLSSPDSCWSNVIFYRLLNVFITPNILSFVDYHCRWSASV